MSRLYWIDALEARALLATVPAGFTETLVATGLNTLTGMAVAPDGRLFVAQQTGEIKVVKNNALLPANFATVVEDSTWERGLIGIALDPTFGQAGGSNYVYVLYTSPTPAPHNRLSRFLANGDVAAGAEQVLVDFPNIGSAVGHMGGSMNFGPDGKLYIAVGDYVNSANAQSLDTIAGKILRFNSDGTIPSDNPFFIQTTGVYQSIWAMGLRNPFTTNWHLPSSRFFINDVGEHTWEEINAGAAGVNYGWPTTEGAFDSQQFPGFTNPMLAYPHTEGVCVIGGGIYDPALATFPAQYRGKYFFGDHVQGWIRYMDTTTKVVTNFATGAAWITGMTFTPDGAMWYTTRGAALGQPVNGKIFRIQLSTAQAPSIALQPQNQTITPSESANFTVSAFGSAPLSYQWQRDAVNITGATSQSYTLVNAGLADDGALFRCIVSNSFGSVTSNGATLTVTQNSRPTPVIIAPVVGTTYRGGQQILYSGTATDLEDKTIPASAFTWRVDLHHDIHSHPFVPPTSGATGGSFTIATVGETSPNVFYRITLTVTDSAGLTQSVTRDIQPRTANITLRTNLPGLSVRVDGQPRAIPATIEGVEGLTRTLEAVPTHVIAGRTYQFVGWSDGGTAQHTIWFPSADATYTAFYRLEPQSKTYLSDINWVGTPQNGWGPVERDMSNGHNDALDGRPITLNGVVYPKGLGAHATSQIVYNLAGQYARFISDVGVDDEAQGAASIVFQVYVDNVLQYTSGLMNGATATKHIDISVAGANTLRLQINDGGNGITDDHGDWADAHLTPVNIATPLVLNGTTNADSWTIRKSTAANTIDVWFNTPTTEPPTQTVLIANIESITVNGLGGDDALIVDTTNGALDGINRIAFDGGTDTDTLRSVGSDAAGGDAIDVSANAVAIDKLPILQTGVENLRLETGDGNDVVSVHQMPAATMSFDGGAGSNTLAFRGDGSYVFTGDLGAIAANFDLVAHDAVVLNFTESQHLGSLKLDGVSRVNVTNTAAEKVLRVVTIDISDEATLDLHDNAMIIDYATSSSLALAQALINAARNGGAWDKPGITSTTARDDAQHIHTLAALEATDYQSIYGPSATFAGEAIDDSAVLIKYTLYGDADVNGVVNFDDYSRTDLGFNESRTGWINGDFDGNGTINFDDYALIDLAFNAQATRGRGAKSGPPRVRSGPA